jgi:hypothetical protein
MNFALLVLFLVLGILFGFFVPEKRKPNLSKLTFGIVLSLMFSLGFGIGSNNEMLNSLPQVGLTALVIASLAITFSVLLLRTVRRKIGLK